MMQFDRNNFEKDIDRRIRLGKPAFYKYRAETWTLMVTLVHKFKVTQSDIERAMLGISVRANLEIKLCI